MADRRIDNRIDQVLAEQSPGLWPFLVAGDPSVEVTAEILRRLNELPIRGVELGIPFSDPIADGPVIQAAFSRALSAGLRVGDVFDMVKQVRGALDYPLLAMVSASIIYRCGQEPFVNDAAAAGFDGLIVPDISLEEAPTLARLAADAGLRLAMLVAPTTPPGRQARIAGAASGFLYYVAVQGTTGARQALAAELPGRVRALKAQERLPVLVGFGISEPKHVRDVCAFSDGAIVGSAIVQRITRMVDSGAAADAIVKQTCDFIEALVVGAS